MGIEKLEYILSQSEMGIYLECQEVTTKYNLPFVLKIDDNLDLDKLCKSVETFMDLHPYLFTQIFINEDGNVMKHIVPGDFSIGAIKDISSLEDIKIEPFNILNDRLFRFNLYRVSGKDIYLFFDIHHILVDGGTLNLFLTQIFDLYAGKEIQKETYTANDYAIDELALRNSEEYLKAKKYYSETFSGLEISSVIPNDKSENAVSYKKTIRKLNVDVPIITNFIKTNHLKTSTFFISAFTFLLSKLNMEKEAMIATIHNGRNENTKQSTGMYVKTFPFYACHKNTESVIEYLKNNNIEMILNVENDLYSFLDASKELGVNADILFAYQGNYMFNTTFDGIEYCIEELTVKDGKGIMSVEVHKHNGEFYIWYEYRSDLYEDDTIDHIIDLYEIVISEFLSKDKISTVSLIDEKQKQILDKFNTNDTSRLDYNKTIVDYFYENTDKHPNNTLVTFKDKVYSYSESDKISSRLSNKLISLGLKAGDVVSVLISKSEYIVLVSLGILKSGCAYQPLDPSYPSERLNFMINDVKAKVLILERKYEGIITDYDCIKIYLDELDSFTDETRPSVKISPSDLFIMLYTSGTTGKPKGVMLNHRNISIISQYCNYTYEEDENSRMSSYPSYGFDAHMLDIYSAVVCGASIYVIPDEMRLDLIKLGEYFNECGITHSFMTTQVGRQFAENIETKTLKYLLVGGEKLVPIEPPKNFKLYNLYGPTEGSIFCTSQIVDKLYHRVPIGKNLDSYKFYIVDEYGNILPYGVKGELYISGEQVADGYLNREVENKKAFIKNTFIDDSDSTYFKKMYRTGDIVRFLKDGNVDFIGRNDGQVKIRGFRVELSEIEQIIRKYPDIKDVTIKDFTDPSGICYLCAYIVSDVKIDVDKLNHFIGENKPSYMIPAYTMQIDSIPLNQNQKVNKRALPVPELKKAEIVKPENESEEKIYAVLSEILGYGDFGVTSDIYECGLSSITSIKFAIKLTKIFGKNFKNSDLKDNRTIRELAKFANQVEEKSEYEILEYYPITKTQEGIFVECLTDAQTTKYNIPCLLKLNDKINIQKLEKAIITALNAHKYVQGHLMTNDSGDIVMKREPDVSPEVKVIKTDKLDKKSLIRPFNLLGGNLYRIEIYECKDSNYLYLDFHHIACDGTSMAILFDDITKAYLGEPVEEETYSGYEIALDEKKMRLSPKYSQAKEYYKNIFSGIETDCNLKKDLKVKDGKFESKEVICNLSFEKVREFAKNNGFTLNSLFNFTFALTLSKYIYRDDAVYTTIYNGRNEARTSNVISMLVKTLPVYTSFNQEDDIKSLVKKMKVQLEESESNDIYSFAEIANEFGIGSDLFFAYQGDEFSLDHICSEYCPSIILESDNVKSAFSLEVFIVNGEIKLRFEYDNGQYGQSTIDSFARLYEYLLCQIMTKDKISDLDYVSEFDKELYDKFNSTYEPIPNSSVCALLEEQALDNPDKIAVIAKDGKYTYREFNENCNRLAHYLLNKNISYNSKVIVLMPRSKNAYVSREGVLKSGSAFVPVDPKYPNDRIQYIIENSNALAVISTKEIFDDKKELFDKLNIEKIDIDEALETQDFSNPGTKIDQNNLCYIIYTSGTTGKPKGVMISHRNLLNICLDGSNLATYEYRICDNPVCLSFASLSFDASLQEEFIPITHGYTACIASEEEIENPMLLASKMIDNNVRVAFFTPSFVSNVLDIEEMVEALKQLKSLDMGAEAVQKSLVTKIRKAGINATLFDGYGPTETTITCTYDVIEDEYITIGKPVANTKLYLLDKHDNILPINALGNLTIAGEGVGIGYLGLEEKTKECFIKIKDDRAYKSGDIARYNGDGKIEFFGRLDNQVKLRGLRVELGEIEKAISSYPGILSVIVLVKNSSSEGDYLCAYYASKSPIEKEDIISHISKTLTPYMVPKIFVHLEKMPLTPNGKVDRKALPEPNTNENKKEKKKAKNQLEEKIIGLFAKALGLSEVGRDEDFFDLGGTSLSVSKVAMLALKEQLPIAYKDVFDYSTPMDLANHIQSENTQVQEDNSNAQSVVSDEFTDEALKFNSIQYVGDIKLERPLGTVLLPGASGFLGLHMLRELLTRKIKTIALIRGGRDISAEERLKALLAYYFDSPMEEELAEYAQIINGDITDDTLDENLKDCKFDTIINCAACVKHFAQDDIIERVNVGGVKNLIRVAKNKNARLIQISTLSVAGENIDDKFPESFKVKENMLYVGQDLSNKYVNSKFMGEKAVLESISSDDLDAKVIRVGNLMGRQSDGEFQINSVTNSFIRDLRSYIILGQFPVSFCDGKIDFSPIDEVAKTIILLAQTNKKFTLFHSANSHEVEMGDVIEAMNDYHFKIDIVDDETFEKTLGEALEDEKKNMLVSSLLSYASSDKHVHKYILTNNEFSIKSLYRLGYKWPITDGGYLHRILEALDSLDFFSGGNL